MLRLFEFRTQIAETKRRRQLMQRFPNKMFVSDALIEMVGDSSVDSSPWLPPDKYYNPGSHITLKCIIRQQLCKHTQHTSSEEKANLD